MTVLAILLILLALGLLVAIARSRWTGLDDRPEADE